MRKAFAAAAVRLARERPFVFLSGDLGFMMLEELRETLGPRFVNAGVAEQNMISVAAGVAAEGMQAWAYSIGAFLYARPFEQIRNDVCYHGLDVKLVVNGGGFAYGPMGPTHHALEDYGALLTLRGLRAIVPAFAADLPQVVLRMAGRAGPDYLRLGWCEKPKDFEAPPFSPWRRLLAGAGAVLVAVGPLAGPLVAALRELPEAARPELWALCELPLTAESVPVELLAGLARTGALLVAEEHVAQGSAASALALALLHLGASPRRFVHLCATGYLSGRYGSHAFHRRECGLDAASILDRARELVVTP